MKFYALLCIFITAKGGIRALVLGKNTLSKMFIRLFFKCGSNCLAVSMYLYNVVCMRNALKKQCGLFGDIHYILTYISMGKKVTGNHYIIRTVFQISNQLRDSHVVLWVSTGFNFWPIWAYFSQWRFLWLQIVPNEAKQWQT